MLDQHDKPITKRDLAAFHQELRKDLKEMRRENAEFHRELMLQLGVFDENLRRDVFGFRDEEIARLVVSRDNHETRIRRLESSVDLVAA